MALANRRQRPAVGLDQPAPIKDLTRNPVMLAVADGATTLTVTAERGPSGKVWLACQCAESLADGWCRHEIDLLCFRYDGVRDADAATRDAFERIVAGTRLATAGRDADRALKAFDACLKRFDDTRPRKVHGSQLAKFTDLISDLAACAAELEDALSGLQRLLERS
jgi:hypothetical protein